MKYYRVIPKPDRYTVLWQYEMTNELLNPSTCKADVTRDWLLTLLFFLQTNGYTNDPACPPNWTHVKGKEDEYTEGLLMLR